MNNLLEELAKTARLIAPDYPNINELTPEEYFYVIMETHKGTSLACQDLHKLVKVLQKRYNIPDEEIYKISKEILNEL